MPELENAKEHPRAYGEVNQSQGSETTPIDSSRDVSVRLVPSEFFPTDRHLLHKALSGEEKLERYDISWFPVEKIVQARVRFGQDLTGHPGIVHGGAIASVFDDVFGVLFFALRIGTGFTANLNVDYKLPIPEGREVLYQVELQNVEGKKVRLKSVVFDAENSNTTHARATALFVIKHIPSSSDYKDRAESHLAELEAEALQSHHQK